MTDISRQFLEENNLEFHNIDVHPQLPMNDHTNYQRLRIEARVLEKMQEEYNINPRPILANRNNEYYFCLNGQHKLEVAARKGIGSVNCYIIQTKNVKEEKAIFEKFQAFQKRERVNG